MRVLFLIAFVGACADKENVANLPIKSLALDEAIARMNQRHEVQLQPDYPRVAGEWQRLWTSLERIAAGGALTKNVVARARALGFGVERWRVLGIDYLAVLGDAAQGRYVFRINPSAGSALLQAPHAYYDVKSGVLAAQLFFDGVGRDRLGLLSINSLHRYQVPKNRERPFPDYVADVAHSESHWFHAATTWWQDGRAPVVQLHGFGAGKFKSKVDVVLSRGDRAVGDPMLLALRDGLAPAVGVVKRFPDDTKKLGATTNVQGRAVNARGDVFLHVELAKSARQQLMSDSTRRDQFARALWSAVWDGAR